MKRRKVQWYWALLLQGLIFSAASVLCVFIPLLFENGASAVERAAQFAVLPGMGGVTAFIATRKGLNNFAAVIVPPVLMPLVYQLITGAAPYYFVGVFVCVLISVVGASAGEVVNIRENARNKRC